LGQYENNRGKTKAQEGEGITQFSWIYWTSERWFES